ncbi:ribokinase [Rhodovulum imhoffii]|uniref:Ribokinase n=1 Tax=Rhodovulum imhoffii TaxID=365340 RepID=A0A2T5BRJ4_9RHOB|nr:ribokinase [Rhodovulum imhoffii]MBK5934020.1 ribokinase [Rhodovulum imhoffii]PTN01905.1 ribokinase [Rhodovulum imhoffii]
MTVFCLGSINVDHVYRVPHLPGPGETLAATEVTTGLGGKGANQSVAAARAGARVVHIGAVGPDGDRMVAALAAYGVDIDHIVRVEDPTGHAIITVEARGENAIVLFPGANCRQSVARIAEVLAAAGPEDTLLLQNETSHQVEAARIGREKGARVIYSAAPFDVDAVRAVLPHVSLLAMNAVEAEQLQAALGTLAGTEKIVTQGAKGAWWHFGGRALHAPAFRVDPVDTTGAGDCFIGAVAAALDEQADRACALRFASAAAALKVTRAGAGDAMPARAEIEALLNV